MRGLKRKGYYTILDAWRFILALWVAVGHYQTIPILGNPDTGTGLWFRVKHVWSMAVFAPPAVIVFFVISGFCIHLPFSGEAKVNIWRFYLRRYTRILIPVVAALVLFRIADGKLILKGEHSILWESVLWSLVCEEIYYLLYPALRWVRVAVGWKVLLPVSFCISVGISSRHFHDMFWYEYGPIGAAMTLLPVWLLGCLLAEQARGIEGKPNIWAWRFAAWFLCWGCEVLNFKAHIYYPETMVWFGVFAYFWMRQEIAYGKVSSPSRYLVAAGAWSYSLYLVHTPGMTLFKRLQLQSFTALVDWFLIIGASLAVAYVFYWLVERPSHRLARRIKVSVS